MGKKILIYKNKEEYLECKYKKTHNFIKLIFREFF